jgi:hypothetical protein
VGGEPVQTDKTESYFLILSAQPERSSGEQSKDARIL